MAIAWFSNQQMALNSAILTSSSSSSDSSSRNETFITWLLSKPSHRWHLRVADPFLEDDFNYAELPYQFYDFEDSLDLLLGDQVPSRREEGEWEESIGEAKILYDLIHQRYLTTRSAQHEMVNIYECDML